MRIVVSTFGSRKLSQVSAAVIQSLKAQGHDSLLASESPYSLSSSDFLVYISEPKGMFGGLIESIPQELAQQTGIAGKRCLALMRKSWLSIANGTSQIHASARA